MKRAGADDSAEHGDEYPEEIDARGLNIAAQKQAADQ